MKILNFIKAHPWISIIIIFAILYAVFLTYGLILIAVLILYIYLESNERLTNCLNNDINALYLKILSDKNLSNIPIKNYDGHIENVLNKYPGKLKSLFNTISNFKDMAIDTEICREYLRPTKTILDKYKGQSKGTIGYILENVKKPSRAMIKILPLLNNILKVYLSQKFDDRILKIIYNKMNYHYRISLKYSKRKQFDL
jgi:hypothetical protein